MISRRLFTTALPPLALALALLQGCSASGQSPASQASANAGNAAAQATAAADASTDPFNTPLANLSGHPSMAEYTGEVHLATTTVAQIVQLMDAGESFAFIAAYAGCPYCNTILPYVNEAAAQAGCTVGYLDTRADPSWNSNLDIDDYDLFAQRFGEFLEKDGDGTPHLYVPDIYYVRDGSVVARHDGVIEGADDPDTPLTEEQKTALRRTLAQEFALLE